MKNHGNILYGEVVGSVLEKFHQNKGDIKKNLNLLEEIVEPMNLNKCSAEELENSHPGTMHYLAYLLQEKKSVNFGICDSYKTWENKIGWQRGCEFDKGRGERIQVNCFGNQGGCERKELLNNYNRGDKNE